MRYLRGALALVVGCVLFAFCAVSTMAVAVLTLRFGAPVLLHAPFWSGRLFIAFVYRAFLQVTIEIEGEIERKNVPTIVIGNHPSLPLTMLLAGVLEGTIGMPVVFVAKREHLWNPLIGWPLWLARLGVFIDRAKRDGALGVIRDAMAGVFARGAALVIFPDQSRPTAQKILDDLRRETFRAAVSNLADFTETLVPREGGIGTLLDAAPDVRVIDVTFGCSQPNVRWSDIFRLHAPRVLIRVREISGQIPTNREDRRRWLVEYWREKNNTLRTLAA